MMDSSDLGMDPVVREAPAATPVAQTFGKRGFAAMDRGRQRVIASKGGSSVPVDKRSFSRDHELAVRAGRKGGLARMRAAQAVQSFGAEAAAPHSDAS
jgi:general stress protein YciG